MHLGHAPGGDQWGRPSSAPPLGLSHLPLGKWGSYVMGEFRGRKEAGTLLAHWGRACFWGVVSRSCLCGATLGSSEYRCEKSLQNWFSLENWSQKVEVRGEKLKEIGSAAGAPLALGQKSEGGACRGLSSGISTGLGWNHGSFQQGLGLWGEKATAKDTETGREKLSCFFFPNTSGLSSSIISTGARTM